MKSVLNKLTNSMNTLQLIQPPQMFKDLNFHVYSNKTQGDHVITIFQIEITN